MWVLPETVSMPSLFRWEIFLMLQIFLISNILEVSNNFWWFKYSWQWSFLRWGRYTRASQSLENQRLVPSFSCCFSNPRPRREQWRNQGSTWRLVSTPWTWRRGRSTTCSWQRSLARWPPTRVAWPGSSWQLPQSWSTRSPRARSSLSRAQHAVSVWPQIISSHWTGDGDTGDLRFPYLNWDHAQVTLIVIFHTSYSYLQLIPSDQHWLCLRCKIIWDKNIWLHATWHKLISNNIMMLRFSIKHWFMVERRSEHCDCWYHELHLFEYFPRSSSS